jgi:hypothetical protein
MIQMKKLLPAGAALLGAPLLFGAPSTASATYTLVIQEVTAGGALVSTKSFSGNETSGDPFEGFLFSGGYNSGSFAVSVDGFANAYASPAGVNHQLEIHALTVTRSVGNTNYLRIFMTKDGYSGYTSGQQLGLVSNLSSISGIDGATVTFQSAVSLDNTAFGVPTAVIDNVPPAGSGDDSPPLVDNGTDAVATSVITMDSTNNTSAIEHSASFTTTSSSDLALTGIVTVTGLSAGESISFDANTYITPAPPALALLAAGIPVLAVRQWLKRRKNAQLA